MVDSLLPAGLLILCGVIWRLIEPGNLPAHLVRQRLNTVAIYLLIPALILAVTLRSEINAEVWLFPLCAGLIIGSCLLINVFTYARLLPDTPKPTKGAMILAGSFGNGVGVAAPVVIALYGLEQARVPIMYTLLGSLPITWTLGVAIALRNAGHETKPMWRELSKSPPLIAVLTGLAISAADVTVPMALMATLDQLTRAAVPIMLFTVGLSLNFRGLARIATAIPAIFTKSVISPVIAFFVGQLFGLEGAVLGALVVTAATASFNVGVVLSDRYELDVDLYGVTVAVTAVLYFTLLPVWGWLLDTV